MLNRENKLINKNIQELEIAKGQMRAEIRRLRLENKPENAAKMVALKQAVIQINLYKGAGMRAALIAALNEIDEKVLANNLLVQKKTTIIQRLNNLSLNLQKMTSDLTPGHEYAFAENIVGLAERLKEEGLNFYIVDDVSKVKTNLEEFEDLIHKSHLLKISIPKLIPEIAKCIQQINMEISVINAENIMSGKRKEQIVIFQMNKVREIIENAKKVPVSKPSSIGYFSRSIPQRIRDAKDLGNQISKLKII